MLMLSLLCVCMCMWVGVLYMFRVLLLHPFSLFAIFVFIFCCCFRFSSIRVKWHRGRAHFKCLLGAKYTYNFECKAGNLFKLQVDDDDDVDDDEIYKYGICVHCVCVCVGRLVVCLLGSKQAIRTHTLTVQTQGTILYLFIHSVCDRYSGTLCISHYYYGYCKDGIRLASMTLF